MTIAIIGIIVCILALAFLKSRNEWQNETKPPQGWIQFKNERFRFHGKK